ncbi:allophanate hydrolase [Bordetella genomosp. 8]|uniref:Allophanate hydrolase n=1 Tax=Bordetella genomosp. 8 TaxID=1416806 RepID=A0A1W6YHS7_9BORD|nr:allophanate hydrolase [Bordetella genomosp. 8]ARP80093.1 allophanate hydrolase [Bordetella genomosp. 8]
MPAPEPVTPVASAPGSASPDHAWIRRFEPAQAGAAESPLSGLRFAVKDNIDVGGQPTTAACPEFAYVPATHAAVVERLLQAGAVLAGKTNLDQFACGLNGTRSPYGAVPNAFDPAYVSGGSSSGSAYVVAAGEMDFALGTDTAGSGRVPAGLNNIVGLKPSRGLIPAHGVFPAAQSVDCVSILARTVATAVKVLEAAAGPDPRDPYSRNLAMRTTPLPARPRVGVPAQLEFFGDTLSERAWQDAMKQVQDLGGTLVPVDYAPLAEAAAMLYDSALVAERYEAVREFFDAHEDAVIQPVRDIIAAGRGYSAADLYRAQHRLQALARQADAMWADIDLFCVPTAPTHCTIAAMLAEPVARNRELGYYTNFVNLLDYAALAIPTGMRTDGLPFGITLIGPAGSDWQLADLGQRLHHATGLPQGATTQPLPAPQPIAALQPTPATHLRIAVVGAHLTGMPLNGQLIERGATLAETTRTAPHYRLYALRGTVPPKPGLRRVASDGVAIEVEVWNVPLPTVGSFLALIPSPLGLGSLELADGRWVHGFICEDHAYGDAQDVSTYGGWRAYVASRAQPPA